jgi:hypothetical protein
MILPVEIPVHLLMRCHLSGSNVSDELQYLITASRDAFIQYISASVISFTPLLFAYAVSSGVNPLSEKITKYYHFNKNYPRYLNIEISPNSRNFNNLVRHLEINLPW